MNLYILKYNNYYNRTIKKEDSLTDYLEYQLGNVIQGVAFNPGDGIATQQVVNLSEDQIGDYLLAVNENNEIDSRWFILDCRRERTGQYTLTLRRDLVTDNYDSIISAPCFIEKATLSSNDPMIFNSENMTFNQIKKSETLLKDGTRCPWIVGYYSRTHDTQNPGYYIKNSIDEYLPFDININDTFENWSQEYLEFTGLINNFEIINLIRNTYGTDGIDQIVENSLYKINNNGQTSRTIVDRSPNTVHFTLVNDVLMSGFLSPSIFRNAYTDSVLSEIKTKYETILGSKSNSELDEILNYNNKTLRFSDGMGGYTYYKITFNSQSLTDTRNFSSSNADMFNYLKSVLNKTRMIVNVNTANNRSFEGKAYYTKYTMTYNQIIPNSINYEIPNTVYTLIDAPYNMFAIPYADVTIYNNGQDPINCKKEDAFRIAMDIAKKYSGANQCYDIQLLPYCPFELKIVQANGTLDIMGDNQLATPYTTSADGSTIGYIFSAYTSSFTTNIPLEITITDMKVENECDMYRLCSPNFNGQFEFSAAKNYGVDYINVDCTYKPYNPYIHLNPNFKGLYGQDFNDSRGLICGGDFSLPIVTSAWETYEIQNKNYQNIFNRQVENLEINNAVQREQQKWQIASGAVGAGMSGALTGAIAGGPIGAVVGGLVGAGTSGLAGWRDYQLSEQLRQEAIDYLKDQFGYQLGNIQALPNNITKTTAFTYNNKIFPILEYYTCTDKEKQALKNKIKYNGMTVMRIGTISEFIQSEPSYIKGKLIRLEGTDNNFHVVNEIANEINKGVFI